MYVFKMNWSWVVWDECQLESHTRRSKKKERKSKLQLKRIKCFKLKYFAQHEEKRVHVFTGEIENEEALEWFERVLSII